MQQKKKPTLYLGALNSSLHSTLSTLFHCGRRCNCFHLCIEKVAVVRGNRGENEGRGWKVQISLDLEG